MHGQQNVILFTVISKDEADISEKGPVISIVPYRAYHMSVVHIQSLD